MSYPTQQQPGTGVPQQPGGVPGQPPFGPYGQVIQPAPATNGLATAGLVLGILPTGILGLIFSILGITRAKKVGGVGRTRAWVGLVLSAVWLAASIVLVVAVGGKVAERLNPGCIAAEAYVPIWESNLESDSTDPDALKADLQAAVTELNSDASKSTNAAATTAITKLAGDIQQVLDGINAGTVPSDALQNQMVTDGAAIDTACGH